MSKYMMKEKGDVILKKGDRVALIYPSQEPGAFAAAFFACLFANLVPVPVEAPMSNMVGPIFYMIPFIGLIDQLKRKCFSFPDNYLKVRNYQYDILFGI